MVIHLTIINWLYKILKQEDLISQKSILCLMYTVDTSLYKRVKLVESYKTEIYIVLYTQT